MSPVQSPESMFCTNPRATYKNNVSNAAAAHVGTFGMLIMYSSCDYTELSLVIPTFRYWPSKPCKIKSGQTLPSPRARAGDAIHPVLRKGAVWSTRLHHHHHHHHHVHVHVHVHGKFNSMRL